MSSSVFVCACACIEIVPSICASWVTNKHTTSAHSTASENWIFLFRLQPELLELKLEFEFEFESPIVLGRRLGRRAV